jgi:hypothetical protein
VIVVPMTKHAANAFIAAHHRHNRPVQGLRFAIGAEHEGSLVGVAIVGRPLARHLDDGETAEVTRLCVLEDAPKGTPSFLYARCWRIWSAMGGHRLVTYTLPAEGGASLRGAGFRIVGHTPGRRDSGAWVNRSGRDWQPVIGQQKLRWAYP